MYFITIKRMLEVCFSAHPNIQYRAFLSKMPFLYNSKNSLLQLRCNKNIINRFHSRLEICVLHADDDVEFTGTLVDHLDVNAGVCQGGEDASGSAAGGLHAASYDGDEC